MVVCCIIFEKTTYTNIRFALSTRLHVLSRCPDWRQRLTLCDSVAWKRAADGGGCWLMISSQTDRAHAFSFPFSCRFSCQYLLFGSLQHPQYLWPAFALASWLETIKVENNDTGTLARGLSTKLLFIHPKLVILMFALCPMDKTSRILYVCVWGGGLIWYLLMCVITLSWVQQAFK